MIKKSTKEEIYRSKMSMLYGSESILYKVTYFL